MRRICVIVFAATATMAAWAFAEDKPKADDPNAAERIAQADDIREAVFRYQIRPYLGQITIFLEIEGKDPSPEFMKRFEGHTPPVKPVSACEGRKGPGVKDKETGKEGIIFSADAIRWKSDSEVAVDGGHYRDGLAATGNVYTVTRKDGKWTVTADRMLWIS